MVESYGGNEDTFVLARWNKDGGSGTANRNWLSKSPVASLGIHWEQVS